MIEIVEQIKKDVEKVGYLSEEACQRLREHFGDGDDGPAARCLRLSPPLGPAGAQAGAATALLDALEEERVKLEGVRAALLQDESLEREGSLASLSLPSKEATEKITRYEGNIERALQRTLKQLERLRMQRER